MAKKPRESKSPIFDTVIEEARHTPADKWISHEELGRRLGITEAERAAARARIERRLREDAEEPESQPARRPTNGTVADVPAAKAPARGEAAVT